MKKIKATFLYELKRIFTLKHCLFFLLFFILSLYLVYFGVSKYNNFLEEKENFLDYERLKVRQYINYEQYGSYGFRVLLQPSPLVIFWHSSLKFLESTIDTKEVVDIFSTYKGQKLFTHSEVIVDFSKMLFVMGTLLMLYFGLTTFVSFESILFRHTQNHSHYILSTIASRWVILTAYFLSVLAAAYFFAKVLGIRFNSQEAGVFIHYALYVVLFLTFFYLLGMFIAVAVRFGKVFTISAYLIWFLLIFAVPQFNHIDLEKRSEGIKSNEIVNIEKMTNGRNFDIRTKTFFKELQEKKVKEIRPIARRFIEEYIQKIMPLNRALENNLDRDVKRLISHYENRSVFFPSSFYRFLAKECSGIGYYCNRDYLKYLLELKNNFYRYYFDKRSNQVDQSVESFIKGAENIYLSRAALPDHFAAGAFITFLYSLLFLGGALYGLHRGLERSRGVEMIEVDSDRMEIGKTYFYFSQDDGQKRGIFNYLRSTGAVIIHRPHSSLYDPGTSLNSWLEFEIQQENIDAANVHEILDTLHVTSDQLNRKIKEADVELFAKVYLALKLAQDSGIYVFDDFLNSVSRELERAFKVVLDRHKSHAAVIYFGSQMFDIAIKEKLHEKKDGDFRFVVVDLNDITLR